MWNNRFLKQGSFLLLLPVILCHCLSAGTHGSITAYEYPVSKKVLQEVIKQVIAGNPEIHIDTAKNYIIDVTGGKNDTIRDDRYNDKDEYFTIRIENDKAAGGSCEYTFQCSGAGDKEATADHSSISIAYAYDEKGNGGSAGNGGVTWTSPLLKKKLTGLFETKFIGRIDKALRKKHTDAGQ